MTETVGSLYKGNYFEASRVHFRMTQHSLVNYHIMVKWCRNVHVLYMQWGPTYWIKPVSFLGLLRLSVSSGRLDCLKKMYSAFWLHEIKKFTWKDQIYLAKSLHGYINPYMVHKLPMTPRKPLFRVVRILISGQFLRKYILNTFFRIRTGSDSQNAPVLNRHSSTLFQIKYIQLRRVSRSPVALQT